jgi:hypothetical protein
MIVAGLDIASRTGLAILDGDKLIHWEAHRPAGDEDHVIFHGFRTWLRPTLRSFHVQHVGIEQPLPTNIAITDAKKDASGKERTTKRNPLTMGTYLRIYGLFGHAVEMLYAMNVPFEIIHQGTWRKSFLGSGRADKDMAIAQCRRLGWPIKSYDAAEAAGVAFHLQGVLHINARAGELFAKIA